MPLNRLGLRLCALVVVAWPAIAAAQASHVSLELGDTGVTLDARNSTLREILDEWERVGGIRILNGNRLDEKRVTLQLTNVPEREAFQILLRDIGGFVLSARALNDNGRSQFASLVVVPANTPLYREPALPSTTMTTGTIQAQPVAANEEPQQDLELVVLSAQGRRIRTGAQQTEPAPSLGPVPQAGPVPSTVPVDPAAPLPSPPRSEAPNPANPFGNVPASTRPGVIVTPVDPMVERQRSGGETPK